MYAFTLILIDKGKGISQKRRETQRTHRAFPFAPSRLCASSFLFLLFLFSLVSCHAQQKHSSADFYEGLKKKQAEAKSEAVSRFEKALDSPNIHIAAAATAELMSLHLSGTEISAATIDKIRKKAPAMTASQASGSWAMALDALGTGQPDTGPDREKTLALALNSVNRPPDEAVQYLLLELRAASANSADDPSAAGGGSAVGGEANIGIFTEAENAAIAGRVAVSRSRYREALVFFRLVIRDAPGLFFQYPELISDLGRSFQYAAAGREGVDLFLQWEKNFSGDANLEKDIRFRLLFFAARIARQRGLTESIELFEQALRWALFLPPGIRSEQIDACVWYILNSSLAQGSDRAIRHLEDNIQNLQDDGYYSDVMDKLARGLLLKRQWADLIRIFALVKNRPGVLGAKFAWIIGRAIQEGLLSSKEMELARAQLSAPLLLGETAGETQDGSPPDSSSPTESCSPEESLAKAYIRIAYNNAPWSEGKALYYRDLSAAVLGEPFLTLPEPAAKPAAKGKSTEPTDPAVMEFLLGFFKNGAAKFAPRYIRLMERSLASDGLFLLAEELGNAGQYQESIRLASILVRRTGNLEPEKRYLELLYPQPFFEQVVQYAQETGVEAAKLYGLIRTESAFHSDAISRAGAIGLTQLMPATAEEVAARIRRLGGPDYTLKPDKDGAGESSGPAGANVEGRLIASEVSVDLLDPGANIHMGAAYLAYLGERMGDPLLALLAYNGGMSRVRRWRNAMPAKFPPDLFLETVEYAETMEYGRSVMGAAAMYRALYKSN